MDPSRSQSSSGPRPADHPSATRSPVVARHGMVCASQPLAAQIGLEILKEGGSAVDAALATNGALGLMEPTGCGVGGDLYALGWDARRERLWAYNGSGRSPGGLSLAELQEVLAAEGKDHIPLRSGLAVSVPGAVEAWFTLHARYGRLSMKDLLAPAITYARQGFPVTPVIARHWQRAEKLYAHLPEFCRTFLPEGRAPREGELFANPDLAATYEALVRGGAEAFYSGDIARTLAACVQSAGGHLTTEDLARHRGEWVEPLSVGYRGYRVWELGPNSQGLAALHGLALLEEFDLAAHAFQAAHAAKAAPGYPGYPGGPSAEALHLMIEAKKLAYADLARHCADPAFAHLPVGALLSQTYAEQRRRLIDPTRAAPLPPPGDLALAPGSPGGDTVYLTAADKEGNLVSWIQSNYTGFGTGLVPGGCGFSLQNRGALFSLDPAHPNCYAPAKRPFHTLIPAMVTREGLPVFSFGVMGGDFQPQGHLQILTNILDFGMDVQAAGDAPRWQHVGSQKPTDPLKAIESAGAGNEASGNGGGGNEGSGGEGGNEAGEVLLEPGFPNELYKKLEAKGHRVRIHDNKGGEFGGYQGIWIDHIGDSQQRVYRGASESRKDGCAVGF